MTSPSSSYYLALWEFYSWPEILQNSLTRLCDSIVIWIKTMKPSLMNSIGLLETCPDPAAKQLCQSGCLDGYTECMTACEVEDVLCKSGCTREFSVCEDNCPCGENCPLGCSGCATYECRLLLLLFWETNSWLQMRANGTQSSWRSRLPNGRRVPIQLL